MNEFIRHSPRVLIVTRLFSGMIATVRDRRWHPAGIPAVYKLIEGLARRGIKSDVVFCCKTTAESSAVTEIERFSLPDAAVRDVKFHVLPFFPTGVRSTKVDAIANGLSQWSYCTGLLRRQRPDIVYVDRSHVVFGATTATWFHIPTFLRILGVYPDQKALFTSLRAKLLFPATYLAYAAPFAGIVCSQDDSGGGFYLNKLPNRWSARHLLLNGVDRRHTTPMTRDALRVRHRLAQGIPILLYVGKMEAVKGCIDFVDIIANLRDAGRRCYGLMLGDGPAAADVQQRIRVRGAMECMRYVGSVDSAKVADYYALADVYVHLYRWASLTNTVLEAMRAGCGLVTIASDPQTHVGEYANAFIPADAVARFDRHGVVPDATRVLMRLLDHPEEVATRRERLRTFAESALQTHNERIDHEIDLMLGALLEARHLPQGRVNG